MALFDEALTKRMSEIASALGSSFATLVSGKVPASQLPSYVDDVLEYANFASLPTIGENGKIYVALDSNKTFRWSGSVYIEIAVETAETQGNLINSASAKTTPVDADLIGLVDSSASNVIKKLSWSNLKATLKTYFDTLYNPKVLILTNTVSENGIALTNGAFTTVYSLPNVAEVRLYFVSVSLGPVADANHWGAYGYIFTDGATARIEGVVKGMFGASVLMDIQLSGMDIQVLQNSGGTQYNGTYNVTRIH